MTWLKTKMGAFFLVCFFVEKSPAFEPPVKKTYLTLLGLTAVFACKIKGFVGEKNRFPEAVKN